MLLVNSLDCPKTKSNSAPLAGLTVKERRSNGLKEGSRISRFSAPKKGSGAHAGTTPYTHQQRPFDRCFRTVSSSSPSSSSSATGSHYRIVWRGCDTGVLGSAAGSWGMDGNVRKCEPVDLRVQRNITRANRTQPVHTMYYVGKFLCCCGTTEYIVVRERVAMIC